MSIDYRAGIAKGYIVAKHEMREAAEESNMDPQELIETLEDKGMLIYLDTWSGGDYIVGFDVCNCDEGMAEYIDELDTCAKQSVELMQVYKQYFMHGFDISAPSPRLITYLSVT